MIPTHYCYLCNGETVNLWVCAPCAKQQQPDFTNFNHCPARYSPDALPRALQRKLERAGLFFHRRTVDPDLLLPEGF